MDSKGPEQYAHLRRHIRTFVVRLQINLRPTVIMNSFKDVTGQGVCVG